MKNSSFNIYFIIVNFKTYNDTIECINSILKQKFPNYINFKIIIFDNASENKSIEKIANYYSKIDQKIITSKAAKINSVLNFIKSDKNIGFGAANNYVFNFINDGYIFLINPDIILHKNFIESIDFLSLRNDFIYGFPTYDIKNKKKLIFYGGYFLNKFSSKIIPAMNSNDKLSYINGSGMLTNYLNFKKYSFDENYFLYWEETDLCLRFGTEKLKVLENSLMYDKISGSIGRGFLSEYYFQRNRLFFTKKFFPNLTPFYLLLFFPFILLKLVKFQYYKVSPIYFAFFHFIINKKGSFK